MADSNELVVIQIALVSKNLAEKRLNQQSLGASFR